MVKPSVGTDAFGGGAVPANICAAEAPAAWGQGPGGAGLVWRPQHRLLKPCTWEVMADRENTGALHAPKWTLAVDTV